MNIELLFQLNYIGTMNVNKTNIEINQQMSLRNDYDNIFMQTHVWTGVLATVGQLYR